MKILALGDVTDPNAAAYLAKNLWDIRRSSGADFVIVNAENAGFITSPDPEIALSLLNGGADVLTGGNHTLHRKSLFPLLENDRRVLRPVNYPAKAPGEGYTILPACGYRVLVINAIGRVGMEPVDCPFRAVERVLCREEGHYDFSVLDFHAEATGEKMAMGLFLDGRLGAMFGTHTHVATADEQVLPNGTGYISDIGYTGVKDSILGIAPDAVIERFLTRMPAPYTPATGKIISHGVLFETDGTKTKSVRRVVFEE